MLAAAAAAAGRLAAGSRHVCGLRLWLCRLLGLLLLLLLLCILGAGGSPLGRLCLAHLLGGPPPLAAAVMHAGAARRCRLLLLSLLLLLLLCGRVRVGLIQQIVLSIVQLLLLLAKGLHGAVAVCRRRRRRRQLARPLCRKEGAGRALHLAQFLAGGCRRGGGGGQTAAADVSAGATGTATRGSATG